MNGDFHYYGTYCAALLAGYTPEESQNICYCAQLVDHCTRTFLKRANGPSIAATTQLQSEMINIDTDIQGLQNITRIWSAFHFLPRDLYAEVGKGTKQYKNKYRLICGPNGELLKETVELAKGKDLQAVGLAMHVLADTWAHTYFAGTPSLVINNTDYHIYELLQVDGKTERRHISFGHNPAAKEDPEKGAYTGSIYQSSENSIMNLGHGRAGHLPDYSYISYAYMPAWGDYHEIIKNNPHDYMYAFAQMVYAMQYLRGGIDKFATDTYAWDTIKPYEDDLKKMFAVRRTDDSADWKALAEKISGTVPKPFDLDEHTDEIMSAKKGTRRLTYLGHFFSAAIAHKSMVTTRIYQSGNPLAGKPKDAVKPQKNEKESDSE